MAIMDDKRALDVMDELLSGECHIMSVLPERVPNERKDEYARFESHMLNNFDEYRLAERFSEALMKLMCYYRSTLLSTDAGGILFRLSASRDAPLYSLSMHDNFNKIYLRSIPRASFSITLSLKKHAQNCSFG